MAARRSSKTGLPQTSGELIIYWKERAMTYLNRWLANPDRDAAYVEFERCVWNFKRLKAQVREDTKRRAVTTRRKTTKK